MPCVVSLCIGSGRLGAYSEVDGLEILRLVHLGPTEFDHPCEPIEKSYGGKLGILHSCRIVGFQHLSYVSKRKCKGDYCASNPQSQQRKPHPHTRLSRIAIAIAKNQSPEEGLEPSTLRFIFKSLTR